MINLLSTFCLLFETISFNTSTTFKYTLTNSPQLETYASVKANTNELIQGLDTLKVGEFFENGVSQSYYSMLNFVFPSFTSSDINSATLTVKRSAGSTGNIDLYYASNPANNQWSYISSSSITGNAYSFSFTNILKNQIQQSKKQFCLSW